MAKRNFIVDLDLNKNQLLNAVLQNLATAPLTPFAGQMYYNTGDNTAYQWNGTTWKDMLASGGAYTHPAYTPLTPILTGANVLATFSVDAQGHVDAATTRVLTLADLGYTGAADANNYVHPTDGVDLGGALTGATVISDVNVNAAGHVTGFATRALTAADIGAVILNDAATNSTETWSSTKITAEIAAALSGVVSPAILAYNASTNTPDLDTAPTGINKGDIFYVSVAGVFFSETVSIGDTLIAKIDNPTTLAHWVTLEKNIPDIVAASNTVQGIIELATQTEVNTGTDAVRAVTPLTLAARIAAIPTSIKYALTFGNGALTTFPIPHNLNSLDVTVQVVEVSSGQTIECQEARTTVNNVQLTFNTAPTNNQYRVIVMA
jgi:hypothetical protein